MTLDPHEEANRVGQKERAKGSAALRLSFFINLASYGFGLILFTVISVGDGQPGYAMVWPAIWWFVGIAGHGLTLVIFELARYYKDQEKLAD